MATPDSTLWGIHAGGTGEASSLFLRKNRLALGWSEMGDLRRLRGDREAFKARMAEVFPDTKPGAVPTTAGLLFRFLHEMKRGDLVVYPHKADRTLHLGVIDGDYEYVVDDDSHYPHRRPVKWLKSFPRTWFSQGALYEIGSALSLFQVKNYADEFRAATEGQSPVPPPAGADESVAVVAREIEETTRDFVLKRLAQELKGHPFAEFVSHLLNAMGFRTRVSPPGPDGGIDILAHKDELGFEPPIIKVQVKSEEGASGEPAVSQLYGKVGAGEHGLFVTLGTFTRQAEVFAKSKSNLRLIDGPALVDLIFRHYESFDARFKGLLPLRRVYVPERLDEVET